MIDGRWLFGKLKYCHDLKIVTKLYSQWIRTNSTLVGFGCEVTRAEKKIAFERINKFIEDHQLPVVISDVEYHKNYFKILIIEQ